MRKILYSLLISLIPVFAFGQWVQMVTPAGTHKLNDIQMTSELVGFAAGDTGTVLKTINGGSTWSSLPTFTADNIQELKFKNADTGWVITYNKIFRTANGGLTFQNMETAFGNTDSTKILKGAYMSWKGNIGIIKGIFGDVPELLPSIIITRKTTDGGITWNNIELPGGFASPINIFDDDFMFIGDFQLYKSRTGGMSWDTVADISFAFPALNNKSFQIVDTLGTGALTLVYHLDHYVLMNDFGVLQLLPINAIYGLTQMQFLNKSTGYAVRSYGSPQGLYKTANGGITYSHDTGAPSNIKNLFFQNLNIGFLCGTEGKIWRNLNSNEPLGIHTATKVANLNVYPNPATTELSINLEKVSKTKVLSIAIYDILGKQLMLMPYSANGSKIPVHNLATGTYSISLLKNGVVIGTAKFIKE